MCSLCCVRPLLPHACTCNGTISELVPFATMSTSHSRLSTACMHHPTRCIGGMTTSIYQIHLTMADLHDATLELTASLHIRTARAHCGVAYRESPPPHTRQGSSHLSSQPLLPHAGFHSSRDQLHSRPSRQHVIIVGTLLGPPACYHTHTRSFLPAPDPQGSAQPASAAGRVTCWLVAGWLVGCFLLSFGLACQPG
jgi:hypothetical protein